VNIAKQREKLNIPKQDIKQANLKYLHGVSRDSLARRLAITLGTTTRMINVAAITQKRIEERLSTPAEKRMQARLSREKMVFRGTSLSTNKFKFNIANLQRSCGSRESREKSVCVCPESMREE
jgi:hypothetical protein